MARLRTSDMWIVLSVVSMSTLIIPTPVDGRPHMVVILADDLGWSDVGFRDSEMHTPNIDRMAAQGVMLNYSYMQQVCTPSRAAFLSGYYPFKIGMQNSVLNALENNSMPLGYRLLPEHMKDLGYDTHFVGKWHLGFCNLHMTPTYRGFDTFYGMYNGKADYFEHISKWNGYDLHNNTGRGDNRNFTVAWSGRGRYSTHLFTERAVEIIEHHNPSTPLFLFLSYQAVHGPLEVPRSYITDYCDNVSVGGRDRKLHCAMTAAMDEGIGQVNRALRRKGFSDNLITLFISDNGGPTKLASSNWPLRGSKITLWEGGTRAVTILHSTRHLPRAPYHWDGLMHAVDWYPTLVRAAGDRRRVRGVDGVNNWERIRRRRVSRRTEFVYNIDEIKNTSAIRFRNYKLINNKPGSPDGWYNPPAGQVNDKPTPPRHYPQYMLFDLEADPSEEHDLMPQAEASRTIRRMANKLKRKLARYVGQMVPTTPARKVRAGKPRHHGGAWVSGWC